MGKLSRRDMEELREACSYDCGYTDTEEVVKDITAQVLEELDSDTTYGDEVGLVDSDRGEEFTTLDDFVRIFWDKAVLTMGEYCKEHDVEECLQGKCGLSVDHDDLGNGDEYNGCIMFGCNHPKYAKMIKKEILKYMKERRKHR